MSLSLDGVPARPANAHQTFIGQNVAQGETVRGDHEAGLPGGSHLSRIRDRQVGRDDIDDLHVTDPPLNTSWPRR